MFSSRIMNNVINKTRELSLRPILNDHNSDFIERLQEIKDLANHRKNIQVLLTEAFKKIKNLAPLIMEGMVNTKSNNNNLFQELVTEKKENRQTRT